MDGERKELKFSTLSIDSQERSLTMLKLALRYARYAVVTLTSVGFALSGN
jgi:hypothetical protein